MAIITATTTPVSSRQGQLCLFFFISIHLLYLYTVYGSVLLFLLLLLSSQYQYVKETSGF